MKLLKAMLGFVIMLAMPLYASAQNITVKGSVKDDGGVAVIGASVVQQGTQNGVITDIDGNYSIQVPSNATLVFSSIGYKDVVMAVSGQTTIDVTLSEDKELLDEVVVIGYGVQKKSDVTGAIASVNSETLQNRSVDNVAAAFAGKTAGVQVLSSSGDPSSIGTIRIRGVSSNSTGASDPLYIVDGLQVSSLNGVDPQNVESIEILKDAASAAIYGAQAGNGVVVVTTKTGEKGTGKIFYNGSYTIQKLGYHPQAMNAEQYIDFMIGAGALQQTLVDQYWDGKTDTDWFEFMFPGGSAQRHTVGAQGANDKGSFYTSISILDNDGMVYGDRDTYKRMNFQLNADYKIKKWLKVGTTNTFQISQTSNLGSMGGNDGGGMGALLSLDPLTPPLCTDEDAPSYMRTMIDNGYDILTVPTGEYIVTSMFNERTTNPLVAIYSSSERHKKNIGLNGTLFANLTPFKGFTYTSRLGYTFAASDTGSFSEPYYVNGVNQRTTYSLSDTVQYNLKYQWENFINYSYTLHQNHQFDFMAGMSYIDNTTTGITGTTDTLAGYDSNFWYLDYSTDDAIDTVDGTTTRATSLSYFGRIGYNFKNKYFLQASFRADAFDTSKLSKSNRWGYFPSVSLGWTVSNEPWIKNNISKAALSFLKFRSSWGINGNINVLSNYQYASTISAGASNYQMSSSSDLTLASYPGKLANEGLKWEKSKQFDFGFDLRSLQDRLSFGFDYYYKTTDDLIIPVTPSYITGQSSVYMNSGSVRNTGVEFEVGWKDTIGDFSYNVSANLSHNKNIVTYLDPTITFINGTEVGNCHYATRFQEGYPVWGFWGYKYEGVDSATGEPIYQDVNEDGKFNESDYQYLGSSQPDFSYGLTLSMQWKNLDMTIFGSGSQGNKIWFAGIRPDFIGRNLPSVFYTEAWKQAGDETYYPAYKYASTASHVKSSAMLYDGSYFRINQIQLGYSLPSKWLEKISLSTIRLYASLDDYFTFSNYIGFDPVTASENAGSGGGIDRGTYPSSKKIMFGINVSF